MRLLLTIVTWTMMLGYHCIVMQLNGTAAIIDELLESSGYPKPGDIPILNRKIFKGQRVGIREHPYIVSIRRQYAHYLVGTLLTRNMILSVAHPLDNVPPTELGIVIGEGYADRGTTLSTVLIVILHDNFDPYTLNADIALLRTYEDINYRFAVKPIPLMSPTLELEGNVAFVTGWGRCDNTGTELCLDRSSKFYPGERVDPMLRSISFPLSISNFYCEGYKRHEVPIRKGMLCIGPAREDDPVCPCLGVPGAPLVVTARLVGLLSWGFGCGYGHDLPLIYTSIQEHARWILHNIVIMGTIKQSNLTQLFHASKAYLLSEWFIKTRLKTPSIRNNQDRNMEPLEVDKALSQLRGKFRDVRDYISGGYYRTEKKNIYAEIINDDKEKTLVLLNKDAQKKPSVPFISLKLDDVEEKWFPNKNTSM